MTINEILIHAKKGDVLEVTNSNGDYRVTCTKTPDKMFMSSFTKTDCGQKLLLRTVVNEEWNIVSDTVEIEVEGKTTRISRESARALGLI